MANEKRLIDANVTEKVMNERYKALAAEYGHYDHYTTGYGDALSTVEDAPTVDAVEVVRCKDCKHNDDCIRRIQFWGRNPVLELNTSEYHPIDFCSYGERKDND